MGRDFIDDLLDGLQRVISPDMDQLREILIVGGMPQGSQNLRYLSYNRQKSEVDGRTLELSVVAVINNRRIPNWRLVGYRQKMSQIVFDRRWTRNPLDLFLNNLRCDGEVMDILAAAASDYTLLGIVWEEGRQGTGLRTRKVRGLHPVVAVPGLSAADQETIVNFESRNKIHKTKIRGLPIYRKSPS